MKLKENFLLRQIAGSRFVPNLNQEGTDRGFSACFCF